MSGGATRTRVPVLAVVFLDLVAFGCRSSESDPSKISPAPEIVRPRPDGGEIQPNSSLAGVWRSNETMRLLRAREVGDSVEFRAEEDWDDTGYAKGDLRFTLAPAGDGTWSVTETIVAENPSSDTKCSFAIAPGDAPKPLAAKVTASDRLWIRLATWQATVGTTSTGTCSSTVVTGNVEQILEKLRD